MMVNDCLMINDTFGFMIVNVYQHFRLEGPTASMVHRWFMDGHEQIHEYLDHLGMVYRIVYENYGSFIDGYRWIHENG